MAEFRKISKFFSSSPILNTVNYRFSVNSPIERIKEIAYSPTALHLSFVFLMQKGFTLLGRDIKEHFCFQRRKQSYTQVGVPI